MKIALYVIILCVASVPLFCTDSPAQDIFMHHGDTIPSRIENMYTKGLAYLVKTQSTQGTWPGQYGTESGVVGLGVLAMLAHGEDPNTGPYSTAIKRSLNYLLKIAQPSNGYMGSSMYNHGFATLALAEAYGVVDNPKIGPALKKSVELLLTCQENKEVRHPPARQSGPWYSPLRRRRMGRSSNRLTNILSRWGNEGARIHITTCTTLRRRFFTRT